MKKNRELLSYFKMIAFSLCLLEAQKDFSQIFTVRPDRASGSKIQERVEAPNVGLPWI